MSVEKSVVEINNKIITFFHQPFDAEVDMDQLTMIHYYNLVGEIITIPTLMNRVGVLKAEADNAVRETKLAHKILEAEKAEYYRKKLTTDDGTKIKTPTVSQIEEAVVKDESVNKSQLNVFRIQKQAEVIDSLYWSIKAKEMKLNQISQNLSPSDFEKDILEESINGILIKVRPKTF